MATLGKYNISSYVDDLIPGHVQSSYPDLVQFIKVYALYLERQNNSAFYLNSLDIQRDIDYVEANLLTELQNEIGIAVPRDFAVDARTFYKRLIEFYRSRGTPESITSFFRMIYDDEVETYFPFVDVLEPSDGDWTDQSADIKINKSAYTPWNVFTISPISAGSFIIGLKYKITVLTGTTQAQWNTAAGTSGVTYAADDTFTAAAVGAGTGTVLPYSITGNNDDGNAAFLDDDVVFVNDTYQTPGTDYAEEVYSESNITKYRLNFTTQLSNGDIVRTYPKGLFTTTNGFLSQKEKRIQDSYYYQQFSYVLKTGKNVADWKNAFTRLIHPAGFKFFGEIAIFIQLLTSTNDQVQYGWLPAAGKITLNLAAEQIGPVSFNSNLYEISWTHTPFTTTGTYNIGSGGGRIGMYNHWDNMKFRYLGPNSDFASYTVQDSINNNIGLQFGMGGASSLVIS